MINVWTVYAERMILNSALPNLKFIHRESINKNSRITGSMQIKGGKFLTGNGLFQLFKSLLENGARTGNIHALES